MTTTEWYAKHKCDHAHCPNECEHPQPFMIVSHAGGKYWILVCGRCALIDQKIVRMVPCKPGVCE